MQSLLWTAVLFCAIQSGCSVDVPPGYGWKVTDQVGKQRQTYDVLENVDLDGIEARRYGEMDGNAVADADDGSEQESEAILAERSSGDYEKLKSELDEQKKELDEQKKTLDEEKKTNTELKSTLGAMSQQIDALIRQDAETRRMIQMGAESKHGRERKSSATDVKIDTRLLTTGGTHYVRWGRNNCPKGVTTLYKGWAAGSYYTHSGGGANTLCMHGRPQWGTTGYYSVGAPVYGTEYEFTSSPFLTVYNQGQSLMNHDAPCAVCYTPLRSTHIMIPARKQCPTGWTFEYRGFIVSNHDNQKKSEFVCLDGAPETGIRGHVNYDGSLFYPAHTACGALPCPPYIASRNIVCVVCTK